jgi:hypothetical protein
VTGPDERRHAERLPRLKRRRSFDEVAVLGYFANVIYGTEALP